jgi:hypothetical protein
MSKIKRTLVILFLVTAIGGTTGLVLYLQQEGIIITQVKENNLILEKTSLGKKVTFDHSVPLDAIFKELSEEIGFHVYYPTYNLSETPLDKDSIWLHDDENGRWVTYNIGFLRPKEPWISVVQQRIDPKQRYSILTQLDYLKSRQKISFNGSEGYFGTTGTKKHFLYSTQDGIAIHIYTKDFEFNTLIKIAQSMR